MDYGAEEDKDNDRDYGGGCGEVRSANYMGKSRAEQTMEQGLCTVYRHPNLPSSFIAKTFERGGYKFPCYPNNPLRYSKFEVEFEGCLGCE